MNVPTEVSIPTICSLDGAWRARGEGKLLLRGTRERPSTSAHGRSSDRQRKAKLALEQPKPSTRQTEGSKSNIFMEMDTLTSSSEDDDLGSIEFIDGSEQQKRFRIFVVVLLQCLSEWDQDLHQEAKALVDKMTSRILFVGTENPSDVDSFLKKELQTLVGQEHWSRADVSFKRYLEDQKERAMQQGFPFHLSGIVDYIGIAAQHLSRSSRLSSNPGQPKKPAPPPINQADTSKQKAKITASEKRATTSEHQTTKGSSKNTAFSRHFESLKKLMDTNYPNGGYVLASECEMDKTLQGWIGHLRHKYNLRKRGLPYDRLTDEQIEQLDSIGFLWENPLKSGSEAKRKRGRPKKRITSSEPPTKTITRSKSKSTMDQPGGKNDSESKQAAESKPRRGRPKRRDSELSPDHSVSQSKAVSKVAASEPSMNSKNDLNLKEAPKVKCRRGRPKKHDPIDQSDGKNGSDQKDAPKIKRRRGRPKKKRYLIGEIDKRKHGRHKKRDSLGQLPNMKKRAGSPPGKQARNSAADRPSSNNEDHQSSSGFARIHKEDLSEKKVEATNDDQFEFDSDSICEEGHKGPTKCDAESGVELTSNRGAKAGRNQIDGNPSGETRSEPKQRTGAFSFDSLSKEQLLDLYLEQQQKMENQRERMESERKHVGCLQTERDELKSELDQSKVKVRELQQTIERMNECKQSANRNPRATRQNMHQTGVKRGTILFASSDFNNKWGSKRRKRTYEQDDDGYFL